MRMTFVEPLYHHVAALVFEELRATGQVMPARILNQFEDVEEQKTAASLFNTRLKKPMMTLQSERRR